MTRPANLRTYARTLAGWTGVCAVLVVVGVAWAMWSP